MINKHKLLNKNNKILTYNILIRTEAINMPLYN